ncbi:MAG: 50S ribosomal protein L29 [Oscillospiraceae bacterium]|nr:50S ribosomal protein L29 [Oscillospiraceae bacterium]
MATKIAKDMHKLSDLELKEKSIDLKQELFNLRFQHAVNQLENPQKIKAVKRQIAVIKTIQRVRELKS